MVRFWLKVMVKMVYSVAMAGEIINLRHMRKQQKRAEAAEVAAQNRARHGRTKAEREKQEKSAEQARRHLDGHKLEGDADDVK